MTDRQKRFCDEYLIDCNATQAAIRAGYSKKTAYSIGVENLKKPELQSYIQEQLDRIHNENTADAKEVIEYLTSVLRGTSSSEVLAMCGDGCQEVIEKHPDEKERISAANTLAKILGIEKQIVNMNADMSLNITVDYGDDE